MQKIEINSKNKDGTIFTEIFVDGKKLNGVRRYELVHGAGNVPILKLDLNALNISVDSEVLMYDLNSAQEMEINLKANELPEGSPSVINH